MDFSSSQKGTTLPKILRSRILKECIAIMSRFRKTQEIIDFILNMIIRKKETSRISQVREIEQLNENFHQVILKIVTEEDRPYIVISMWVRSNESPEKGIAVVRIKRSSRECNLLVIIVGSQVI